MPGRFLAGGEAMQGLDAAMGDEAFQEAFAGSMPPHQFRAARVEAFSAVMDGGIGRWLGISHDRSIPRCSAPQKPARGQAASRRSASQRWKQCVGPSMAGEKTPPS